MVLGDKKSFEPAGLAVNDESDRIADIAHVAPAVS